MERYRRASVAGIATAALLAGSVGAAMAVTSPPPPTRPTAAKPTTAKPTTGQATTVRPELTARASARSVWAWQQFRIKGTAKHMRPGTKVTLQQKHGKRWVSLPASMNLTRNSAYNLRVLLGLRGHNQLRIVGGGTASPVVKLMVR